MQGWKSSELSVAGKEVLIKYVLQALPNYVMSCFLLPKKICHDLERLVRRFWWGGEEKQRKVHWIAWDKMTKPKEDGGLSFKDFHDFNVALLAKQSWRFIQKPNTLCCRVFKSKYFPSSSILDFEIDPKRQVSYAFRSIIAGRDLLKSGLAWRIGSGDSVSIFDDRWVPRANSFGLFTVRPAGVVHDRVSSLMVPGHRAWDLDVLDDLFVPADVEAISSVSIAREPFDDHLFWFHTDDGCYTVASGYKAQCIRSKGEPSSSSGHIFRPLLRKLWKLKVPRKAIFRLWRLWHGSLAAGSKFRQRGIHIEATCSHCLDDLESEEHLFLKCPVAQEVWGSNRDYNLFKTWNLSSKDLLIHVLTHYNLELIEEFCMIIWAQWRCRCELRFDHKTRPPKEIRKMGLDMLLWFKEANNKGIYAAPNSATVTADSQWRPPEFGKYTLNTDAAWKSNGFVMGLGCVIRDHAGNFCAGRFLRLPRSRSPLLVELQALVEGMKLIAELQYRHIVIQSDSQVAIKLLRDGFVGRMKEQNTFAEMKECIADCKNLLSHFDSHMFSFINRSGNSLAHLFAQKGLVEDDMSFYFQTADWAIDVFSADLLGLTPHV